jgi:hypothetical protein
MKKILIVPGNFFVSRNYFSSPLIEKLYQMSTKEKLVIYVAGIESNPVSEEDFSYLSEYFQDNYNIILIPLMNKLERPIDRVIWFLKNNFLQKSITYRFNEINEFVTHQRFKNITNIYKKMTNNEFIWKTDIWPKYLGFPFPKSKFIMNLILKFLTSKNFFNNPQIIKSLKSISPNLVILGDIQSPISFAYTNASKKLKIRIVGNVRTWDHLTKNGPVVPNLDEYWVWNNIMREELNKFHKIRQEKIYEVGSPQFDYYSYKSKLEINNLIEYYNIINPLKKLAISPDSILILFATNRPHRGIGEESIIEHICENIALGKYSKKTISIILRSHPYDETFNKRFKKFNHYPFVKLMESPKLSKYSPEEFREDMINVSILLQRSNLVLCGQSTFVIDASCTDTPIVNIAFEGELNIEENLSVNNRYNVDHYQKLLSMDGTILVQDFNSLDISIKKYLTNPSLKAKGRKNIKINFAGRNEKSSSDLISERISRLLS